MVHALAQLIKAKCLAWHADNIRWGQLVRLRDASGNLLWFSTVLQAMRASPDLCERLIIQHAELKAAREAAATPQTLAIAEAFLRPRVRDMLRNMFKKSKL